MARWIGRWALDGTAEPVLWEYAVFKIAKKLAVQIHRFVGSDAPGCYHTHPSWCVRFILWGRYVDEQEDGDRRNFWPGTLGIISPGYCHRIELISHRVITLWITGPKIAQIMLRGPGWTAFGIDEGVSPIEKQRDG